MFQATRDKIKAFVVWLMMLNDTPRSIAMGVAVGLFVGLTPTVGLQMVIVAGISMFVRLNRTAGCAIVWITNPLTIIPIYFANYLVGAWLLRIEPVSMTHFAARFEEAFRNEYMHERLLGTLKAFGKLTLDLAGPLWLGSVVVALVLSMPAYFLMKRGVLTYRLVQQRRIEASLARESSDKSPEAVEENDGKTLQDR